MIVSDDEDKEAPPKRNEYQESAIIGGFNDNGGKFAGESTAGMQGSAQIQRNNTHHFEPEFQSIRKIPSVKNNGMMGHSQQEGNTKQNQESSDYNPDSDVMKQWQSVVDNQHKPGAGGKHHSQQNAGPSRFAQANHPQDSMMMSIPQEGGFPRGTIPPPMEYNFMNTGNDQGNIFAQLGSQYQGNPNQGVPGGPRMTNFGPNPSFGLPSLNSQGNMPLANPFELLSGGQPHPYSGGGIQGDIYPLDHGYRRQDCYGASNFTNQVNHNVNQGPSLYDQFRYDQQTRGNDPCFYKNLDLADSPPMQPSKAVEVSDAVLRDNFERYSVGGVINTANFMKLIEEIYTFNRRPRPDYRHCLYVMSQYDSNRDGCIDFEEFKIMMKEI